MSSRCDPDEPMAIVGMSFRLSGGITTDDELWDLLVNKRDTRCRVPRDRYSVDAFYGEQTHKQNTITDFGYFLDSDLTGFDSSFFSMKRAELGYTDPQLRILLEIVWECLESAGQTALRGTNTGVFLGVFGEDWHNMLHKDDQLYASYRLLSGSDYALSNIISFENDFKGPSMTIRTACSSSMTSLHLACQSIRNGDCPTAIVAGSSLIMDPTMTIDMSEQGVLSADGRCKTFDAAADGFARGEAINALLIKPLSHAIRDGDPVRAVIRSTALNSDGRTPHIGTPSSEAQISLIRRAYEAAGIERISDTPFIECHGTGTIRGDPLEVKAVAAVFGGQENYIGSVKPNLGHCEGAAALTSVIKAVLSLEHETIIPNANFLTPNPKIPFDEYKLHVPTQPVPWPEDRPARISINSFGIGGANGHVIIDSAASFGARRLYTESTAASSSSDSRSLDAHATDELSIASSESDWVKTFEDTSTSSGDEDVNTKPEVLAGNLEYRRREALAVPSNAILEKMSMNHDQNHFLWPILLPLSAQSENSLRDRIQGIQNYLRRRPASLSHVAYTLSHRRVHLNHRAFCVIKNSTEDALEFTAPKKMSVTAGKDDVVFVYTGQGAQWYGMAKTLLERSLSFREDIQKLDKALQELPEPPQWTIEELLCSSTDDKAARSKFNEARFVQPLTTAIQIGLTNVMRQCGVTAAAVIGHSSGEIAAAYTAGALTMSEAIICAYFRGKVMMQKERNKGSMAAIGMSRDDISEYLHEGAQLACENSPQSVTISGDSGAVDKTMQSLQDAELEVFMRKLQVEVAYHSHHMQGIAAMYEDSLTPYLSPKSPSIPFYSTVYGTLFPSDQSLGASYWRQNLESPVLFHGSMTRLLVNQPNAKTLLEVGPHSALQGPIRQILQASRPSSPPSYLATLKREKDSASSVLESVGQLFVQGYKVNFDAFCPQGSHLPDLPSYPWDRGQGFWKESRISKAWRFRDHAHHELLGSRCLETTDSQISWRNILNHFDVSWLSDHKVRSDIVFPAAGFISMMGEAIRQITGSLAYTLRNVTIKAALVMPDSEPIELYTTMRPWRASCRTDSTSWYEFSISSFNGNQWTENCVAQGEAVLKNSNLPLSSEISGSGGKPAHKRKVEDKYFYDRLENVGLRYGSSFQGMKDISARTDTHVAACTIKNDRSKHEASYALHPATIDCCIQLGIVAYSRGIARAVDQLVLPIDLQHVIIHPIENDLSAEAVVDPEALMANVTATGREDGRPAVEIAGGRCIPFNAGDATNIMAVEHMARAEWLPDVDCVDRRDIFKALDNYAPILIANEKYALACSLQLLDIIDNHGLKATGDLQKSVQWLKESRDTLLQDGGNTSAHDEARTLAAMDIEGRKLRLQSLFDELATYGHSGALKAMTTVHSITEEETVKRIFDGSSSVIEEYMKGDGLHSLYETSLLSFSVDKYLYLNGHSNPTMRVLEIGAGTASFSKLALKSLAPNGRTRMYSQYVFSDLSPAFFAAAKERLTEFSNVHYQTLNIEKDPVEQGYEAGSFDLVLASNVLHATSSLHETLKNIRTLLRPGGRLVLHELTAPINVFYVKICAGFLPGWWSEKQDSREDGPAVSPERWDQELRNAGFSGNESVSMGDGDASVIITSSALGSTDAARPITLLYDGEKTEFAKCLARHFENGGTAVEWSRISDKGAVPPGQMVIATVDLEKPYFADMTEYSFSIFMEYLHNFKGELIWLTRASQFNCVDPHYGIGVGLFRTTRVELGLKLCIVEVDVLNNSSISAVEKIYHKFSGSMRDNTKLDSEYAVHEGVVQIPRYHWTSPLKELEQLPSVRGRRQYRIGQAGSIDSLHWVQVPSASLGPNDVEVQVRCVGLNFKDIMTISGIVPGGKDSLGLEATGIVTRVGSAVQSRKVGDRVMAVHSGCLATRNVIPEERVMSMPDSLSFEEAASIPVAYATTIYALRVLGNLERGQSILIHSATGGVGQAAIHISQRIGAEIYTTVGNTEKVEYLVNNFNIPRERILHSRNRSFRDDIMSITGGRGVDMVLNSLSGDLLQASWQCVAKGGKMMEIGKRDMLEHGHLPLDLFQDNRTFYGIDLNQFWSNQPKNVRKISTIIEEELGRGDHIVPIRPIHTFSVDGIADAVRIMKKGQHIGKIVIQIPPEAEDMPVPMRDEPQLLSAMSSYLLVGGLGGLGKHIARWMVERGAKSLCFLSPSANDYNRHGSFYEELEDQGCQVHTVAGSVAKMADVEKVTNLAPYPIAGVIQLSMVIKDHALLKTGYNHWVDVLEPKVKGTWNLHEQFSKTALDFFILFGSTVGVTGQPGQANYSAANSFLDAFTQYRHKLGLTCSVIDLGAVASIGFLTTRPDKVVMYRNSGVHMLQEDEVMESLRIAMHRGDPSQGFRQTGLHGAFKSMSQAAVGFKSTKALSDPRNTLLFKGDIRFGTWVNMDSEGQLNNVVTDEVLLQHMRDIEADPTLLDQPDTLPRFSWEIGLTLFKFLVLPEDTLDIHLTLEEIGVDSLSGIEIRNWWRRSLGLDITVLEILNAGTIEGLGKLAISAMREKYTGRGNSGAGAENAEESVSASEEKANQ